MQAKTIKRRLVLSFLHMPILNVLGEVTKYMRENRDIKVSRDVIKLKQSISKARDYLRQKLQREPSDLELSINFRN